MLALVRFRNLRAACAAAAAATHRWNEAFLLRSRASMSVLLIGLIHERGQGLTWWQWRWEMVRGSHRRVDVARRKFCIRRILKQGS